MSDKTLTIGEAIRKMQQNSPMMMELIKTQAELLRVKYLELKKAGFTDKEAIELCKGPIFQ